jgi:hypothetical protein
MGVSIARHLSPRGRSPSSRPLLYPSLSKDQMVCVQSVHTGCAAIHLCAHVDRWMTPTSSPGLVRNSFYARLAHDLRRLTSFSFSVQIKKTTAKLYRSRGDWSERSRAYTSFAPWTPFQASVCPVGKQATQRLWSRADWLLSGSPRWLRLEVLHWEDWIKESSSSNMILLSLHNGKAKAW